MLEKIKNHWLDILFAVGLASIVLAVLFVPQEIRHTYESLGLLVFLWAGGFFLIMLGRENRDSENQ